MRNCEERCSRVKLVKIHEPTCPSKILQIRPKYDLRLFLNKRKQLHKSGTSNNLPSGMNKSASFKIDRRIKMSRQEVHLTVFENASVDLSNVMHCSKESNTTNSNRSDTGQTRKPDLNKTPFKIEYNCSSTNIEEFTNRNTLISNNCYKNTDGNVDENVKEKREPRENCKTTVNSFEINGRNNKVILNKETSETDSSDSNDNNDDGHPRKSQRKRHPNRRLTLEKEIKTPTLNFGLKTQRNDVLKNVCTQMDKYSEPTKSFSEKKSKSIDNQNALYTQSITHKQVKVSKIWEEVLNKSDLWKKEECWCQGSIEYQVVEKSTLSESPNNYYRMLGGFCSLEETRHDLLPLEKQWEHYGLHLKDRDFYIPPAHAQLLWWKLTDDLTAVECVRQVCDVRRWPEPEYQTTQIMGGWTATLQLHSQVFSPLKQTLNAELAKELAAQEFLERLNIRPRPTPQPSIFALHNYEEKLFSEIKDCVENSY